MNKNSHQIVVSILANNYSACLGKKLTSRGSNKTFSGQHLWIPTRMMNNVRNEETAKNSFKKFCEKAEISGSRLFSKKIQ